MKKEVQEVREQSLAMELLQDYKKANKRFFIIWLVTFIAFIVLVGYVIYLHNDIGTETTTTESHPEMYKKYKKKIMGMAYNYEIDKDLAHEIVEDMKLLVNTGIWKLSKM